MPGDSRTISLFLCGDVMIGRGVDQIQRRRVDPPLYESYVDSATTYVELAERASGPIPRDVEPDYVWGEALAEIEQRSVDARIVNLETALTTSDAVWLPKGVHYRAHPANVAVLEAAAVDGCTLANNHLLDWGAFGLGETIDALDGAGIRRVGGGANAGEAWRPAVVDVGSGARVLVVGFGSTNSGIPPEWAAAEGRAGLAVVDGWSTEAVRSVVDALAPVRREGDIVVVSIHWGPNWGHRLPGVQRRLAHALIDEAGADVVHGHSSHHPRAVEIYRRRPILYGAGDFITDYEGIGGHDSRFYRGDLAAAWFGRLSAGTGELEELTIVPFRSRRLRLEHAPREDWLWLAKALSDVGRPLGTRVEVKPDGSLAVLPR